MDVDEYLYTYVLLILSILSVAPKEELGDYIHAAFKEQISLGVKCTTGQEKYNTKNTWAFFTLISLDLCLIFSSILII